MWYNQAAYTIIEVKRYHYRKEGKAKVLSDEIIALEYNPEDESGKKNMKIAKTIRLRL
jgi:hypothetical protein